MEPVRIKARLLEELTGRSLLQALAVFKESSGKRQSALEGCLPLTTSSTFSRSSRMVRTTRSAVSRGYSIIAEWGCSGIPTDILLDLSTAKTAANLDGSHSNDKLIDAAD
nr:hypothetical protein GCM10025732_55510 [Glycomyces mayteni]